MKVLPLKITCCGECPYMFLTQGEGGLLQSGCTLQYFKHGFSEQICLWNLPSNCPLEDAKEES
jgi:hypothetical protein